MITLNLLQLLLSLLLIGESIYVLNSSFIQGRLITHVKFILAALVGLWSLIDSLTSFHRDIDNYGLLSLIVLNLFVMCYPNDKARMKERFKRVMWRWL